MRAEGVNKLFAEFMGIQCECYILSNTPCYIIKHPSINDVAKPRTRVYLTEEAAWQEFFRNADYRMSWDWLMPILEKIRELGYTTNLSMNASGGCCTITGGGQSYLQSGETLLEAAYKNTVKFVERHRQKQIEAA